MRNSASKAPASSGVNFKPLLVGLIAAAIVIAFLGTVSQSQSTIKGAAHLISQGNEYQIKANKGRRAVVDQIRGEAAGGKEETSQVGKEEEEDPEEGTRNVNTEGSGKERASSNQKEESSAEDNKSGLPEHQHEGKLECLKEVTAAGSKAPLSVVIAGNRPVGTYLCDYFPQAKPVSGGCMVQCPLPPPSSSSAVSCTLLKKASPEQLYTSDVVVNHHGPVPKKKPGVGPLATMYYTGESNYSEPKKSTAAYQTQYDIVVSFHTFRKYHFTWTHRFQGDFMKIVQGKKVWPDFGKQKDAVAVFVSRCKKGTRDHIIRELQKHIMVHSFGKCVPTAKIDQEHPDCAALPGGRYPQKLCAFSRYKYVLTLDNSHEQDYVTEKVYHGLLSGSIPIYDGAPNYQDFVPQNDAVVLLSDFRQGSSFDFAALVKYLKGLGAKNKHTAWRDARDLAEWNPGFVQNMQHPEPTCDICLDIANQKCEQKKGK